MIERAAEAPLYRQIADGLRRQIVSGTLGAGDQIPSEAELQKRHGVSRMTVRLAVQELRNEGLVVTGHGKGTFVADPRTAPIRYRPSIAHPVEVRRQGPDQDGFAAELAPLGLTGSQRITVERRGAPQDIADRLGLSPGDPVVLRHRLQTVEGRPPATADSWIPVELVEGTEIESPEDVKRGTDQVMAELGYPGRSRRDEITARMPTPDEAQELGIAGGVPVVLVQSVKFTTGKRPVEVFVRTLPSNGWMLVYETGEEA
jgi:GntR family transcriptional regulator